MAIRWDRPHRNITFAFYIICFDETALQGGATSLSLFMVISLMKNKVHNSPSCVFCNITSPFMVIILSLLYCNIFPPPFMVNEKLCAILGKRSLFSLEKIDATSIDLLLTHCLVLRCVLHLTSHTVKLGSSTATEVSEKHQLSDVFLWFLSLNCVSTHLKTDLLLLLFAAVCLLVLPEKIVKRIFLPELSKNDSHKDWVQS